MNLFEDVQYQYQLIIDKSNVVYLNHYPFLCYAGTYRNDENATIQLYGHIHANPNTFGADNPRLKYCFPYQYDVGVDLNNYTPISWEQVKEKIKFQIMNNTNVTY